MGYKINGISVTGKIVGYNVQTSFPPIVLSVTPSTGVYTVNTPITITGQYLTNATAVSVGAQLATSVVVVDDSTITASAPSVAFQDVGDVSVNVTTPLGTSENNSFFTYYVPAPVVNGASPSTGTVYGGTTVVLGGNYTVPYATSVTFNGVEVQSLTPISAYEVEVITPASVTSGPAAIVMTSPYGTYTGSFIFSYAWPAPTVDSITPVTGYAAGGADVEIAGTGFFDVSSVSIGGTAVTSYTVNSDTSISAVTPAHLIGSASVIVATAAGSNSANSLFTYLATPLPVITSISPSSGTYAGGTEITITGENFFDNVNSVVIGAQTAVSFTVVDSTTITAITRPTAASTVNLYIGTASGNSNTVPYTFIGLPVISSVTPSTGDISGDITATISGQYFTNTYEVQIGLASALFTVIDDNTIEFTVPQAAVTGTANIVVKTDIGNSAKSPFVYTERSLTLTPPAITYILVDVESGDFTVDLVNGLSGETVTVTPTSSPAGLTFTPTSVELSTAQTTATFTAIASVADTYSVGLDNNAGISSAPSVELLVSNPEPFKDFVAISVTTGPPPMVVYEWDDTTGFGTKLTDPAVAPLASSLADVQFSPSGTAVAYPRAATADGPIVYHLSKSGFGAKFASPSPTLGNVTGMMFNRAGTALLATQSIAPRATVYHWDDITGFGTKYADPSTAIPNNLTSARFTSTDDAVVLSSSTSPYIFGYTWDNTTGFGTKFANPATGLASAVYTIDFSENDQAVVIATTGAPRLNAYAWNSSTGFGTKYANPSTTLTGGRGFTFTASKNAVIAGTAASPYIAAYVWSNASGFGTRYSNPTVALSGPAYGVTMSPSGAAVIAAHGASPYISAYAWDDVTGFGTKYADPTILPTNTGLNVSSARII